MRRKLAITSLLIIFAVVILDQLLKIWVKTSFYLGEELVILPWFRLLFIENNGMAFGMTIGSKLALTLFRIVVVGILGVYLAKVVRIPRVPAGYVVCLAFIIAGAAGNIFDCLFYGLIFNNPWPPQIATFVEWGHGYAPLCMGKVVDMLYFPLFTFTWPAWLPMVGGTEFEFFHPVFNLADASISCGIIVLIIFYHRYILMPAELRKL